LRSPESSGHPAGRQPTDEADTSHGFSRLLLVGVVTIAVTLLALGTVLYLLPTSHLEIPELQPAVRVGAESDFPVGGSRVVTWGEEVILIVRRETGFRALEGTSPFDECILRWESASGRVVSPCSRIVYDLRGNVVDGLSRAPLRPYSVFLRDGIVYVTG